MSKESKEQELVDEGVQRCIFAIRQELMRYFKGTSVDRFNFGVQVQTTPAKAAVEHWIDRHTNSQMDKRNIYLNGFQFATIQKQPEIIRFRKVTMARSEEFKAIDRELRSFMEKYLGGVIVETDNSRANDDGSADRRMMIDIAGGEGSIMRRAERSFNEMYEEHVRGAQRVEWIGPNPVAFNSSSMASQYREILSSRGPLL